MTPHIEAKPGDYAETVLMPGDPLRAAYIAENFLENSVQVNGVRNCLGFTGWHKGHRISVQASGMGQPSLGIYATELFDNYGVQRIIRLGTCGAFLPNMALGDLVIPISASSDSQLGKREGLNIAPCCTYELLEAAVKAARTHSMTFHTGAFFASDHFYNKSADWWHAYRDAGILGVDMETYYLYLLAMERNKQAITINIVSDNFNHQGKLTPQERIESSNKSFFLAEKMISAKFY